MNHNRIRKVLMNQLRRPSRAVLFALTFTLSSTAALAQGTVPAGPEPGPSMRLMDPGQLEITGRPATRVLLLLGSYHAGTEVDLRRVEPQRVIPLQLDLDGRALYPAPSGAGRTVAQAWQPAAMGSSTPGGFSLPLQLTPLGGPLDSLAKPGDLVITEFMKDPTAVSDGSGEWVEIRSNLPWRLDLEGVVLSDSSGASFMLQNGGAGIMLRPRQRFVIGSNADFATNGGVDVDIEWSGFSLKNSSDEIFFHDVQGNLLDAVVYDDGVSWPDTPGMSISLSHPIFDPIANDDPALWCHATSVLGGGPDTGTPGTWNDVCP